MYSRGVSQVLVRLLAILAICLLAMPIKSDEPGDKDSVAAAIKQLQQTIRDLQDQVKQLRKALKDLGRNPGHTAPAQRPANSVSGKPDAAPGGNDWRRIQRAYEEGRKAEELGQLAPA